MNYQIKHTTRYEYSEPVSLCQNLARLTPLNNEHQICQGTRFEVSPSPGFIGEHQDYFGNIITRFDIQEQHNVLEVAVTSNVMIVEKPQSLLFSFDAAWEQVRDEIARGLAPEMLLAKEFTMASRFAPLSPLVKAFAMGSFLPGRPILEATRHLMHRIFTEFSYDPSFTTLSTPIATVLEHKRGVCQDFAHLAIACIRSMGLAARYVSGYIETVPPEGQEKLEGADASHAWFSVFLPGSGWMDFDPTNDTVPGKQHIRLAVGRDYFDVTPLKGVVFGGGANQLSVAVDVKRMAE